MPSTTSNLKLYKYNSTTDGNNTFNIDVALNENWDKIDADSKAKADSIQSLSTQLGERTTILTASGTANAITLPVTLTDKTKYSFKAINNSTGAVTINGKAFKKLDGTAISTVKANKVYDFYYDQSQSSVFILAKAEGDATVANVLAGKIFSNGDDTGLVGTMPNKVGSGTTITPSMVEQAIPQGYYDGSITSGKVTATVTLTAGTNLIYDEQSLSLNSGSATVYAKITELTINYGGIVTVNFGAYTTDNPSNGYARIYKNGVAIGVERALPQNTPQIFSENITVNPGDKIQIYGKINSFGTVWLKSLTVGVGNSAITPFIGTGQYKNGKKYATGTVPTKSDSYNYYITGLAFQPSIVIASIGKWAISYYSPFSINMAGGKTDIMNEKRYINVVSPNSNGFTINIDSTISGSCDWIAIE